MPHLPRHPLDHAEIPLNLQGPVLPHTSQGTPSFSYHIPHRASSDIKILTARVQLVHSAALLQEHPPHLTRVLNLCQAVPPVHRLRWLLFSSSSGQLSLCAASCPCTGHSPHLTGSVPGASSPPPTQMPSNLFQLRYPHWAPHNLLLGAGAYLYLPYNGFRGY